MLYPETTTKPAIEVRGKLSDKYISTDFSPACQLLGIVTDHEDTGISLRQQVYTIMTHRHFSVEHTHSVSTVMHPNVQLDCAEDQGEKELKISETIMESWDH